MILPEQFSALLSSLMVAEEGERIHLVTAGSAQASEWKAFEGLLHTTSIPVPAGATSQAVTSTALERLRDPELGCDALLLCGPSASEILLGAGALLDRARPLMISVDAPFNRDGHNSVWSDVDRALTGRGYSLLSMRPERADTALRGPVSGATAVYFLDPLRHNMAVAWTDDGELSRLLKLVALYAVSSLPDCAAELLTAMRESASGPVAQGCTAALDSLTPSNPYEAESYEDYIGLFNRDPRLFYASEWTATAEALADTKAESVKAPFRVPVGRVSYSLSRYELRDKASITRKGFRGVRIKIPEKPWQYAALFSPKSEPGLLETDELHVLEIAVRRVNGVVGVGFLSHDGSRILEERTLGPRDSNTTVRLPLPASGDPGVLVIRNGRGDPGSGAIELDGLRLRTVTVEDAGRAAPPAAGAISDPVWRRYLGRYTASPEEELRAVLFERLDHRATVSWGPGLKARLRPGDPESRALFVSGQYKPDTVAALRRLLRAEAIVVDAGAGTGLLTIAAASVANKGRVYALEPDARAFRALKETVSLNNLKNVTTSRTTLGARRVLAAASEDGREMAIAPVTTLDRFAALQKLSRLDLVRLSLMGAEAGALLGGVHAIDRFRPAIVIETSRAALQTRGNGVYSLLKALDDLNYKALQPGPDAAFVPLDPEQRDLPGTIVAVPYERAKELVR